MSTPGVVLGQEADLRQVRQQLQAEFDAQVVRTLESASPELRITLSPWRMHRDPSRDYYFLPDAAATTAPEPLAAACRRHADGLLQLAERALQASDGQLANQVLHEALTVAPNHAEVRGRLKLPTRAASNSARQVKVRRPRRHHPLLGWPGGSYREIQTNHFEITTDDESESPFQLAKRLESLHGVWRQLFFDFWGNAQWLRSRGAAFPPGRRRHQVVLFKNRAGYLGFVARLEPQAEQTRGYYHAASRTSYFIGGAQPILSTWYHEATHQLFQEVLRARPDVADDRDFWAIEGVALYMESLHACGRWHCLGGLEAERLQYARFRALREQFLIPVATLASLGRRQLQQDPRIGALYSQSAGLMHFLLHGNGGAYQRPLFQYLEQVYAQRNQQQESPWRDIFGVTPDELDRSYQQFLQVDDGDLQQLDPSAPIRQLCLGGGRATDVGLASLPTLDRLRWLDLFALDISDRGTQGLQDAGQLRQLSLENTPITDETVSRLAKATSLTQLDLSGTLITDRSLSTISQLPRLETLWLTGTQVTDRGLTLLTNLRHLRKLDVAGTRVTPAALQQLRDALPQLSD